MWRDQYKLWTNTTSLGNAVEILLQSALIDKSIEDAVLSTHRLIQSTVICRLSKTAQSKYFDAAVRILSWGFPDTWNEDVGHQFQSWTKCDKCFPHVNHLVKQAKRHKISPHEIQLYGELLLRCSS